MTSAILRGYASDTPPITAVDSAADHAHESRLPSICSLTYGQDYRPQHDTSDRSGWIPLIACSLYLILAGGGIIITMMML